jgi:alpha-galactosidase
MAPKIVVVGAGSMEFGLASLAGIMRTEGLHGLELALVDINPDKLRTVKKLADRMNREWDAEMRICASTELREVGGDAAAVLLCVALDREQAWIRDQAICREHGITSYAENGGPGGFAHACRNLALVLPIVRVIEECSPRAYLLNFTNPLTRLCTAVHKLTRLRSVGICHGIGVGYAILGTALYRELGLELEPEPGFYWNDESIESLVRREAAARARYEIRAAGINHFTWILSVWDRVTNAEAYPLVHERIKALPPNFEPLTQHMYRVFGLVPVQSDTHISEYVPYASDLHDGTYERYAIQTYGYAWSHARREDNLRYMRDAAEGRESLEPLKHARSEREEFIVDALLHNRHAYEEAVNIPNRGYISNLPDEAIVEVPGIVDASGISGLHVGALPEPVAELCRRQLTINDLLVDAFVTGDRSLVYQLFAIDPMVRNLDTAVRLADALIEANKEYFDIF